MKEENRQHRRINKSVTMQFCLADASPRKWDMSVIENISAGGVRFKAPSDLNLSDKTIYLLIKIPELAPHQLELEAIVLECKPRNNAIYCDIRAKFINLSKCNTERLSVIEKTIKSQEDKKTGKH